MQQQRRHKFVTGALPRTYTPPSLGSVGCLGQKPGRSFAFAGLAGHGRAGHQPGVPRGRPVYGDLRAVSSTSEPPSVASTLRITWGRTSAITAQTSDQSTSPSTPTW